MRLHNVMLAVDEANLYYSRPIGCQLNYAALIKFAQQFGQLTDAAIYVPMDNHWKRNNMTRTLFKDLGFTRVIARRLRQGGEGQRKSGPDTAIVLDVWDAVLQAKIDTVVLASGDADFLPLVEHVTRRGISVFVVGPDRATAWELTSVATKFINTRAVDGLIINGPEAVDTQDLQQFTAQVRLRHQPVV